MGDYIRFISADCALKLRDIEALFKAIDDSISFVIDVAAPNHCEVFFGSEALAALDINTADEDIFEEDIDAMIEEVAATSEPRKGAVLARLRSAQWMLAMELFAEGHTAYDRIDQIWDMLFERCGGLLQIDDEGYYDADGEVLSLE